MARINMNSIPTSKPAMSTIIPKGQYLCKIVKSEMKQGQNLEKPPYFSAECDVTDPISRTNMGKFWINLYESEAALVRYQLGRFIKALGLNIVGEFELKDLTKMVNGKSLMVDIKPEERKDGGTPQRSVVDIDAECFYPVQPEEEAPDAVFLNAVSTPEATPAVQANY